MMHVNDYSHLSSQEALEKFTYVANRIFAEQFHEGFVVRDVRPEFALKYELAAFWEDRKKEISGWHDPVGQAVRWLRTALESFWRGFWYWTIRPFVQRIVELARVAAERAFYWAREAYNRIMLVREWIIDLWRWTMRPYLDSLIVPIRNFIISIVDLARRAAEWAQAARNTIVDAWRDIVSAVQSRFEALSMQVAALPQAIAAGFESAISYIFDVLNRIWRDVLVPFGRTIEGALTSLIENAFSILYEQLRSFLEWVRGLAPITPEKSNMLVPHMLKLAVTTVGGLGSAYIVGELLHPLKEIGLGHLAAMIFRVSQYDIITGAIIGAMATSLLRMPLGHFFNYLFMPRIPTTEEAGEFWRRGLITEEEFKTIARYHGFADRWGDNFFRIKERLPSVDEATRMFWREVLTEEELRKLISDQGFREKYAEGFVELTKVLPSPSDLVRFVVREVELMPIDYPTPLFFIDAMKKWGYEDYWARAYWWSHWELPAFGQLQDAFFRGIITEDELRQFIRWHDYTPTPRPGIAKSDLDIMFELIFRLPDKIEARFMRRWGLITTEQHKELLKMGGIHPEWIDRVALAEAKQLTIDERSEVKSAYRSQFLLGLIRIDLLREKLRELFFTPEEVSLLMDAADARWKYELARAAVTAATYSYRVGKITAEELSKQLTEIGLPAEKVQAIVATELARAIEVRRETLEERVYIYGRDVVVRRYREGLTTPVELETEFKMIGYRDRQIERLRVVAELERDYDFAMSVLSALRRAYRKKKIGDITFINLMREYGFTDEKIRLELGLVKLERGLGLEEEVGA